MERPILVDTSGSFVPDDAKLRELLLRMHERYADGPVHDPEWLHDRGHSYGHVRTFRLGVHCDNAAGLTGQESIAWVCDLLLNRSTWMDDRSEMRDLAAQTDAIYRAVGIIAAELGHDMTYAQSVCLESEPRTARLEPVEDPDGPPVPQHVMSILTDGLPSLNYLSSEQGNRKHNLRFGSSEPPYIPAVAQSSVPALERIGDALSCIEPMRRMKLIAQCAELLEGRSPTS